MNSSDDDSSDKYVVINALSVFVCLLAAILVFILGLHDKIVYRLALYQVLAALVIAIAQLLQVLIGNAKYNSVCIALGWFGMYFQWVKLLFTVWITFHLFCFAILHKNLKKLEVLYAVTSLLVPILIAAVPLITHSYGYSSVDGCYIPAYAGNVTLNNAIIERFALWDGPAMVILLVLSITMAVMVIKLGGRVYGRLQYEQITDGDQFSKALKQLLPLAAFPILFFLFIIPVFIYDFYYSFVTPTPNENVILTADIFIFLWSLTSGLTLIVHITVVRVPVCIRCCRSVKKKEHAPAPVISYQDVTFGNALGSKDSKPVNSNTSFPLPNNSIVSS